MFEPLLLAASLLTSENITPQTQATQKSHQSSCRTAAAFLSIGGGYSWSEKASIRASSIDWDPAPQGYNSNVKQSEVYTAGIGYHFSVPVSILFETGYRPSFKYSRYQSSVASGTPGFLGVKTRHFRLSSLAFLFDAFLNKRGDVFNWKPSALFTIAPFIGAGLGVSYNNVYDFHSVQPIPPGKKAHPIHSIENNKVHAAFAGQVLAGFVFKVSKRFSFDLGYRWFYGGKFLSNNYLIDVSLGSTYPESTTQWKGVLRANEIFLNLNYSL